MENEFNILEYFSSFDELKWFTTCCKRVTHDAKIKENQTENLTVKDLKNPMIMIIKLIQGQDFPNELKFLKSRDWLEGNLAPFIDCEGVSRVGGRVDKVNLPFSQKHPTLLPQHHHFTDVIIREEHIKMMEAYNQRSMLFIEIFWLSTGGEQSKA